MAAGVQEGEAVAAAVLMPQPPGHELGEADPETVLIGRRNARDD